MSSKKWCAYSSASLAVVMLVIAIINILCDPFGVFGDRCFAWYSYDMTNNPRTAKTVYLDNNPDKYDSFIIGCSSTSSLSALDFNKYLDASFYNMIMYGADMADVEKTVKFLVENHKVKNIVLNVYLGNAVSYDECPDELTYGLHSSVSGESACLFYARHMFANPIYSAKKAMAYLFEDEYLSLPFDTFDVETGSYDKRKRDAESVSDIGEYLEDYPVFADYPKANYSMPHIEDNAKSVRKIKEMCDEHGVKLITVTAPVYYDYFKYFSKSDIAEFYTSLAEASGGFWDFAVSSISLDPRYFYDETHFKNAVGKMVAAKIFEDEDVYMPDDFGNFVTSENAAEHIEDFYGRSFDDNKHARKISVLVYHHIDENVDSPSVVSPKAFDRQMKVIHDIGFETITLQDLIDYIYKGKDLPRDCVLITFDDGYLSVKTKALPILRKYGFRATAFTIGSSIGSSFYKDTPNPSFPHFSYEDIQALNSDGIINVQSHSYDLHQMKEFEKEPPYYENMLIGDGEDEWAYAERIKEDFKKESDALGYTPFAIAFPHGDSDLLLQSVLNDCGIKLSFTTEYKASTIIKGLPQSGYRLGRFSMYEDTDEATLRYFLGCSQLADCFDMITDHDIGEKIDGISESNEESAE